MGRPAAFDREEVLEQVVDLFWRQGFAATSVNDVVAATALKPGSIYNAFHSKQQMLLEALDRYGRRSLARAQRARRNSALETTRAFLEELVRISLEDPDGRGCFLVNTWLELSHQDAEVSGRIEAIFARIEAEFHDVFTQARKRGELKAEADPAVLAKFVMMSIWGLRVLSRTRPERAQLEALVDQVLAAVREARA